MEFMDSNLRDSEQNKGSGRTSPSPTFNTENQDLGIGSLSSMDDNLRLVFEERRRQKEFLSATNNIVMIDEQVELD